MAGATTVARARAIFEADTRQLEKGVKHAEQVVDRSARSMDKSLGRVDGSNKRFGKSSAVLGKAMKVGMVGGAAAAAAGIYGLTKAIKIGIGEFSQSAKVTAQTNAVIKSTGGAAHVTAKQVDALANSIMKKTGIDDEQIKSTQNMLLTFTNIRNEVGKGNDVFTQATKIATDMGVALGVDSTKASIQLGKALNDPIKGITALTRVGVSFTKGQKAQIESLVESGDTMAAQKIILAELNKEFGGSAEAVGKTLPGQLNILRETFNNLMGDLVAKFVPTFTKLLKMFVAALPAITKFAKDAGQAIKDFVNVAVTSIQELGARINIGPMFTTIVDTVDALIHGRWEQAWQSFQEVAANALHSLSELIPIAVNAVAGLATQVLEAMGLGKIADAVSTQLHGLSDIWSGEAKLLQGLIQGDGKLIQQGILSIFKGLGQLVYGALKGIPAILEAAIGLWANVFKGLANRILDATGLGFLKGAIGSIFDGIRNQIQGAMKILHGVLTGDFQEIKAGIVQVFTGIGQLIVAPFRVAFALIKKVGSELPGWARQLGGLIVQALANGLRAAVGLGGVLLQKLKDAGAGLFNAAKGLGSNIVQGVIQGVKDSAPSLEDAGRWLGGKIIDAGKRFVIAKSPSLLAAREIGQPIGEGVALGIRQSIGQSTTELVAGIQAAFKAADKAIAEGEKLVERNAKARASRAQASTRTSTRTTTSVSGGSPGRTSGGIQIPRAGALRGGATHTTAGLPGNRAQDLGMGRAGAVVLAPENGRLTRTSGKAPSAGGTTGLGYGYSLYYIGDETGDTYYVTHLSHVAPKGRYRRGDAIAIVADPKTGNWGSPAHAHAGVSEGVIPEARGGSSSSPPTGGRLAKPGGGGTPRRTTTTRQRTGGGVPTTATRKQEAMVAKIKKSGGGGRFANSAQVVAFIRVEAPKYGIDADAAIAVAQTEGGLNPKAGAEPDSRGTFSVGPFQLNSGGALPSQFRNNPQKAADWAWSPAGVRYALKAMGGTGARGKTGGAAIEAIVKQFEKPAARNVAPEIARAKRLYRKTPRRAGDAGGDAGESAVSRAERLASNAQAAQAILKSVTRVSKAVIKGLDPDERGVITKRLKAFRQMVAKFMKGGVVTDAELKAIVSKGKAFKANILRVFEVDQYRDDITRQGKLLDDLFAKGFFSETQYAVAKQQLDKFQKMVKAALKDGVISEADRDNIKAAWEALGTVNREALKDMRDLFHVFLKDGIVTDEDLDALASAAEGIGGVLGDAIANAVTKITDARAQFDDAWGDLVGQLEELFDQTTIRMSPNFVLDQAELNESLIREGRDLEKATAGLAASGNTKLTELFTKLAGQWTDYYKAIAAGNLDLANQIVNGIIATEDEIAEIEDAGDSDSVSKAKEHGDTIIEITKNRGQRQVEAAQKAWEDLNEVDRAAFLTRLADLGARLRSGATKWEAGYAELLGIANEYGIDINSAAALLGQNFQQNLGGAMTGVATAVAALTTVLQQLVELLGGAKAPTDNAAKGLNNIARAAANAAANMERLNATWAAMTPEQQAAATTGGNRPGVGGPIPTAMGAELNKPTFVLAGEAGREWIIPEAKIPRRQRGAFRRMFHNLLRGRGVREMQSGGFSAALPTVNKREHIDRWYAAAGAQSPYIAPWYGDDESPLGAAQRTVGSLNWHGNPAVMQAKGQAHFDADLAEIEKQQQAFFKNIIFSVRRQYAGNLYGSRAAALTKYAGNVGPSAPSPDIPFKVGWEERIARELAKHGRNVTVPITIQGSSQTGDDLFPYLARARYAAQSTFGAR